MYLDNEMSEYCGCRDTCSRCVQKNWLEAQRDFEWRLYLVKGKRPWCDRDSVRFKTGKAFHKGLTEGLACQMTKKLEP